MYELVIYAHWSDPYDKVIIRARIDAADDLTAVLFAQSIKLEGEQRLSLSIVQSINQRKWLFSRLAPTNT